jgi:kynurenine formamidase
MEKVRTLARKVSNWGRWGPEDEIGTLNLVTAEVVRRASECVKRGAVFSLGLRFESSGPQIGNTGRVNPIHLMSAIDAGVGGEPGGFRYNDDFITMPLQCATQWDALAHVHYDGRLYNGHPISTVTAAGASRNSIEKIGRGVISRVVLLDLARLKGVDRLAPGVLVTPADLDAAEERSRTQVRSGDVLLLRTGHLGVFKAGDRQGYMTREPGLGADSVEWLRERDVAAVAADTMAVEVIPFEDPKLALPFHMLAIRDMGLTLGEMFDLDELAEDSARDGVYECFFCAPALKITGGVGSPLNPLAVK